MSTKDHKFCSKQISQNCIKSGPPDNFAVGRTCQQCHNAIQLQYYYAKKKLAPPRPTYTYITPLAQRDRAKARYQKLHPNVKRQIRLQQEVAADNKPQVEHPIAPQDLKP